MNPTAIYLVTNNITGHQYVGLSKNPIERWNQHRREAFNRRRSGHLYNAMRKHGLESFELEVLEWTPGKEAAAFAEVALIRFLKPEYNLTEGGDGCSGYVPTSEDRAKQSANSRGKPKSLEARAKYSQIQKARGALMVGRKLTAEICAKISASTKGKPKSPQARANMAAAQRGKTHTEATRAKLRAAHLGRKLSPETCAKMSLSRLGRPCSPETRAKISAAHRARSRAV